MEAPNRYTDFSLSADPDDVVRLLGYGPDKKPGGAVARMLGGAIREAEELARPCGIFSVFESGSFPEGTFLSTLFKEDVPKENVAAVRVALAICTIGPLLEGSVTNYSESGQLTRALVIDAVGSSLTEAVADFINEKICRMAAERGLYHTPRTSPGYGQWKIEEQKSVFELLPAGSIGVSLTESCMMIPRKSVSFAVKLLGESSAGGPSSAGQRSSSEGQPSPCKRCGKKDCQFRR